MNSAGYLAQPLLKLLNIEVICNNGSETQKFLTSRSTDWTEDLNRIINK